jgi:hypothetical protein
MYGRRQSEHQHAYPTENANAGGGHRTTSAGFGFGLLDGPRWGTCCALPLVGCLGPASAEIGQVTCRAGPTWGQRVGLRLYACLPDDDDGRVASRLTAPVLRESKQTEILVTDSCFPLARYKTSTRTTLASKTAGPFA